MTNAAAPDPADRPQIDAVSAAKLAALRNGGFLSWPDAEQLDFIRRLRERRIKPVGVKTASKAAKEAAKAEKQQAIAARAAERAAKAAEKAKGKASGKSKGKAQGEQSVKNAAQDDEAS